MPVEPVAQSQRAARYRRLAQQARAEAKMLAHAYSIRAMEMIAASHDSLAKDAELLEAVAKLQADKKDEG